VKNQNPEWLSGVGWDLCGVAFALRHFCFSRRQLHRTDFTARGKPRANHAELDGDGVARFADLGAAWALDEVLRAGGGGG